MKIASGYQRYKIENNIITLLKDKKNQVEKFNIITSILPNLIKDKTVLDIGASNGVFSFFCALNGATKVVALENENQLIGGTNIQLLHQICKNCNITNVKPVNMCYSKFTGVKDTVLALAVMHHLYYNIYKDMNKLIKSFSDKCNENLIIEWVDVRKGGPYQNKSKIYTFEEFETCIKKYFSSMEKLGITNSYTDPERKPRVTYLCKK